MILVLTRRDERRFDATCPYSKGFVAFLRALPTKDRTFRPRDRRWSIDYRHLRAVVEAGERFFGRVDDSDLGFTGQGAFERDPTEAKPCAQTYAVLHLLPSAPPPVVKAAYRALARLHHPDTGGSARLMAALTHAYTEIENTWT